MSRGSRLAWFACLLSACAAAPRDRGVAEDGWDAPAPSASVAPKVKLTFPELADLLARPEVGRVPTAHLGGPRRATLRTSEAAAGYGSKGRAPFAPGAVLIATLSSADATPVAAHYVMRKREPGYYPEGGDWEYLVVSGSGEVMEGGKLGLCARCHAEARREHVFEPTVPGER